MDTTWFKLYRKITTHPIFDDESAFRVFIWILCRVDYQTGQMKFGRFWAADILRTNPNTLKDIIKRLEKKHELITTKSTNKFTVISVLKWDKYQSDIRGDTTSDTNKTPTKHQQNTTSQEYKNIRKDNLNIISGHSSAKKPACPLMNGSPLKSQYPNGHTECVEYFISAQEHRDQKFINSPSQFNYLHKILRAGIGFDQMDDTIPVIEKTYGRGNWDFSTLVKFLEKRSNNAKN